MHSISKYLINIATLDKKYIYICGFNTIEISENSLIYNYNYKQRRKFYGWYSNGRLKRIDNFNIMVNKVESSEEDGIYKEKIVLDTYFIDGDLMEFYPNGQLHLYINYSKGHLHGKYIILNEFGNFIVNLEYSNGIKKDSLPPFIIL